MRGYEVKEKRTTKIDIAQKLNLSIATVDRVFNNRGSVSPRTRELVLEAARELNYIPNKNAKYLSKKVRCNIGISYLLPEWFGSQVERGIQQAYEEFRDFGMQLIISKDALDEKEQIRKIREMLPEIDALAVAPWEPGTEFSDFINSLIDSGIPVVTFNNDMPLSRRLMYVGSDYVVAGRCAGQLMDAFLEHQGEAGIVIRSEHLTNMGQRVAGFRNYLSENSGIRAQGPFKVHGNMESVAEQVKEILVRYPQMRGIFVASDNLVRVADALKALGEEEKVSLVGYDLNEEHAELLREGRVRSVICQEPYRQGYEPVKVLFDYLMEGRLPVQNEIITKMEIVMRENLEGYYKEMKGDV